ncbi:MAG: hypothetical protein GF383_05160 [Candidatus Lokiarchaeota archaeon]|nr:hypothetical protein [Candidatus Lokiarchaeota archaeon]MBD3339281.1 hypothetical protein [Candidatus Lokiarchaeota archaeon]
MAKTYQITPNLYISDYRAAKKLKRLSKKGITAIVNLMEKNKYNPGSNFSYLFKPLIDRHPIAHEDLEQILNFIDQKIGNDEKVLVHCASGISRSGGIVVARLMVENPSWTWDQARKFVRKKTMISPHPEIRKSILEYFKKKEISESA